MNQQDAASAPLIEAILACQAEQLSGTEREHLRHFTREFLGRVAVEDLELRGAAAWAALAGEMRQFASERQAGRAKVRVQNEPAARRDASAPRTIIEIVTDDMPFLVDSVSMAVRKAGLQLHGIIHPVFRVERDANGRLTGLGSADAAVGQAESVMYLEIERVADGAALESLERALVTALEDVRASVGDWESMRARVLELADELADRKLPIDGEGVAEAQAFLRWLGDDNFTFLGYREYEVIQSGNDQVLQALPDSGLGILRGSERAMAPRSLRSLVATSLPHSGAMDAIIVTKTNARASVHRPGYMDYIGVLGFNEEGVPVREQRFLGLFTSSAYMLRPQDVPLVRRKVAAVLRRSGLRHDSHTGKTLRHVIEALPRDELFQGSEDELYDIASGIVALRERPRTRLFLRSDKYGRFHSCLVYMPRDRFSENVRSRIEATLKEALHGERVDSTIQVGESPLASLHLLVRPRGGERVQYDVGELESRLAHLVRNWQDELREALIARHGEEAGLDLAARYGRALPAGYIEEVTPRRAVVDVELAASLTDSDDIRLDLYPSLSRPDTLHFKVFRRGADLILSDIIPLLENMGLRVLAEQLYDMKLEGGLVYIQDITVQPAVACPFGVEQVHEAFQQAFACIWRGDAENDAFNKLLLSARLDWRQIAMLRGYCKYLLQTGVPFSQSYMEATLNHYPAIARLLVELFEAAFDPHRDQTEAGAAASAGECLSHALKLLVDEKSIASDPTFIERLAAARAAPRADQVANLTGAIKFLLGQVRSLDEDRILRAWLGVIGATLRTSYYQLHEGAPAHYISYKFDPGKIADLPRPVPYREIFVYAPRVEAVHLRFGAVARGGLRWSDRREDFRTEVLGLVKAQMVKNTVIVPVGSKGGFYVKRPPVGDRDALQAEGIACYKMFIDGMLDITDNLVDGKVVHPARVVRRDGDDPYLVVAADKGTARFSDIANSISAAHGYWLADAFASGGSAGYDHKGMGITAKGAWESVKRHFRSLGHDAQSEDFRAVGIGDMSGDVFGNGMLRSRHIRLVAAFDHRHVFVDPNPDAAASYVERERLFRLPRSSWADYDAKLISKGGGVFARDLKSVAITPEMREALDVDAGVEALSPTELISAVLRAPVDLLWNGGIGTYVKASSESNADVGDRANNGLRVNGGELRCKVVGEGGNLGFTQKGRIEAALNGVILNTDFIDNSAGVDTSDHEVNIKILFSDAIQRGELDLEKRNILLKEMTAEVERLVLADNYRQNQALTLMEHLAPERMGANAHFIKVLEAEGHLDRQIESLPSAAEIEERKARHQGLTRPELAILLSYSKLELFEQLVHSDVPEDPYLSKELVRYFPHPLQQSFAANMQRHHLKREIIATIVTNSIVNRMDATFVLRMREDTGQTPAAVAKAYTTVREVLDSRALWSEIEALDGKIAESVQIEALLRIWDLQRNLTRWLLNHHGAELDIAALVTRYAPGAAELRKALPAALSAPGQAAHAEAQARWSAQGVPEALAVRLAALPELGAAFDMIEVAEDTQRPIILVAAAFYELGHALDIDDLRQRIESLPVESGWHAQARGSLRDELASQQRALVAQILTAAPADASDPVAAWLERDDPALRFTLDMLAEIRNQEVDYPVASVALRRVAQLVHAVVKAG